MLAATDGLGLAVWEEIPIVNTITMSDAFADHSERMLVEMIRQHYNYPSVVMWGTMNEVLLRLPDPVPEGYVAAVRGLAERLDAVAKREDPHRLTVMAFSNGEVVMDSGLHSIPDVFGMNLYFGWYYDDFAALGTFLDSLHAAHPDRPLMISEYGAGTDERVHSADPRAFDFSVEHGAAFHRASFRQIRERDYLVGSGVWNQFDFGSNHRQDTKDALNQKGLFFYDRTPKDVAYWYEAVLADAPVLHVEREHTRRAANGRQGATQPVRVYTNAARVALSANDTPVGDGTPDDGLALFDVPLADGSNRIEVEGTWPDGATRTDAATIHYSTPAPCMTEAEPCAFAYNFGGSYTFTDPTGLVYVADPRPLAVGRTHHRIYGADEDPRFQSYRLMEDQLLGAAPEFPAGTYEFAFGFMEPEHDVPGERVFSVLLDGEPVIADLDLAAEAGRWTAVERTVRFTVAEARVVAIEFVPSVGVPVLSSLVIRRH